MSRPLAVVVQGAACAAAAALAIAVWVLEQGRADWIGGPFLLLFYGIGAPVHLVALAATSRTNARVRGWGVFVGSALLIAQASLFVGWHG